jgi:hypothetical protein
LNLWAKVADQTLMSEKFKIYLNEHSHTLLHLMSNYLRRELRVPKYSEMYDDITLFDNETEAIFREKSDLEEKLN